MTRQSTPTTRKAPTDRASPRGLRLRWPKRCPIDSKTYNRCLFDGCQELVMAIDEFKRLNNIQFLRSSDYFKVITYLGYRKVALRAESIDGPFPGIARTNPHDGGSNDG